MESFPIQPENFELIAKLTGKTIEELQTQYREDQRANQATFLLLSEYKVALRKDACFYNFHWAVWGKTLELLQSEAESPKDGARGKWVCALHGQESKYEIEEGSRLPCLGVDPYP